MSEHLNEWQCLIGGVGMSEIVDFLLARLAEDERIPKMLEARGWLDDDPGGPYEQGADGPYVEVSARRVLAEVEAKRRIVEAGGSECGERTMRREDPEFAAEMDRRRAEWTSEPPEKHWPDGHGSHCDGCAAASSADADRLFVLKCLATVYADHADYRQEWRP